MHCLCVLALLVSGAHGARKRSRSKASSDADTTTTTFQPCISEKCSDIQPPRSWRHNTCQAQRDNTNNCQARRDGSNTDGYCEMTCGVCKRPGSEACVDVQPPASWRNPTCESQRDNTNNCAARRAGTMNDGYCHKTCGVCQADGGADGAGLPWCAADIVAVKSYLYKTIYSTRVDKPYPSRLEPYWTLNHIDMNAAKILRLTFHDCLKYEDGTGGCDGCLDWHGVGYFKRFVTGARDRPNAFLTDNNGLDKTVEGLERIYTRPLPGFTKSLQDTGKSRADLWALAGIVAVEFSIQAQNLVCGGKRFLVNGFNEAQCLQDFGSGCRVNYTSPIEFRTGRRDCQPVRPSNPSNQWGPNAPYKTAKRENHPSLYWGGRRIAEWMRDNFNFNGQETVAIMGAHTIGSFNEGYTGLKYTWTSRQETVFNNVYYKNMVGTRNWFHDDDLCTPVGDAWGQKPKAMYVPKANMGSENGGPFQWIRHQHTCPNCVSRTWRNQTNRPQVVKDLYEDCCNNKPRNAFCRPDNNRAPGSELEENPPDFRMGRNGGCEAYNFIFARDEAFLSTDYGLYKDFDYDPVDGFPTGCVGLERFRNFRGRSAVYAEIEWEGNGQRYRGEPTCPLQTFSLQSQPLHEIVQRYADDQEAWINDFSRALEKMQTNGYSNLAKNPTQPSNVNCAWPSWNPQNVPNNYACSMN